MENEGVQMPRLGLGKLRCDSAWAALTPEQREMLEGWLFEENLGYSEVLERAQREFGITASKMSLTRYYQRLAAERAQREFLDLETAVKEIKGLNLDWSEMGSAAMGLIAKRLLQLSMQSPEQVKEIAWLGKVLVDNEAQNIRRGWLNIARAKFELNVARERADEEAEREIIAGADILSEDEEVLKIRRHLFGTNLPT